MKQPPKGLWERNGLLGRPTNLTVVVHDSDHPYPIGLLGRLPAMYSSFAVVTILTQSDFWDDANLFGLVDYRFR